jgi:hypothetical protein
MLATYKPWFDKLSMGSGASLVACSTLVLSPVEGRPQAQFGSRLYQRTSKGVSETLASLAAVTDASSGLEP